MSHDQSAIQPTHRQSDWPVVFEQQRVEYLILNAQHDNELLELFRSSAGWKIDFEDRSSVLLRRSRSINHQPIAEK